MVYKLLSNIVINISVLVFCKNVRNKLDNLFTQFEQYFVCACNVPTQIYNKLNRTPIFTFHEQTQSKYYEIIVNKKINARTNVLLKT